MNNSDFHTALTAERTTLIAQLQALGIQNPNAPGDWIATPAEPSDSEPDPNDLGDRSEDWNERHSTVNELEIRLRNVDRALQKIAAGTYGTCEISGEPIEADRLAANPAARTCKAHLADEANLST